MDKRIKESIKKIYSTIVTDGIPCGCSGMNVSEDYSNLNGWVPDADFGLECGIPTELAQINFKVPVQRFLC